MACGYFESIAPGDRRMHHFHALVLPLSAVAIDYYLPSIRESSWREALVQLLLASDCAILSRNTSTFSSNLVFAILRKTIFTGFVRWRSRLILGPNLGRNGPSKLTSKVFNVYFKSLTFCVHRLPKNSDCAKRSVHCAMHEVYTLFLTVL